MAFLATWGCARDVLDIDATKIQNYTPIFLWHKNLKSEIIQILLSHSPRYEDVQVSFSRFY